MKNILNSLVIPLLMLVAMLIGLAVSAQTQQKIKRSTADELPARTVTRTEKVTDSYSSEAEVTG